MGASKFLIYEQVHSVESRLTLFLHKNSTNKKLKKCEKMLLWTHYINRQLKKWTCDWSFLFLSRSWLLDELFLSSLQTDESQYTYAYTIPRPWIRIYIWTRWWCVPQENITLRHNLRKISNELPQIRETIKCCFSIIRK